MKIFNGKKEASKLDEKMKVYLSQGRHDKVLAIVQVGENPVSDLFIKLKTGLCKKFALACKVYGINANLTNSDISKEVKNIVDDKKVGGAIIQLPLPRENLNFLLNLIPLEKDMDFLSNKSLTQLKENKAKTIPPAVRALDHFLLVNNIKIANLKVTILGAGRLVGMPIAYFLHQNKANLTIMDSSKEVKREFAFMPGITLKNNYRPGEYIDADLLVSATNVPNLIEGNFLKKGTNVVDFGATMHEGRVCGNFKRSSPKDHLANLSLVPGGMGPLVIRYLLMNFLKI